MNTSIERNSDTNQIQKKCRGRPRIYNLLKSGEKCLDRLEYQRRLQALYRSNNNERIKTIAKKCYEQNKVKRNAESKAYYNKLKECYRACLLYKV